jgi:kynurenine formamidase
MRALQAGALALLTAVIGAASVPFAQTTPNPSHTTTKADIERWKTELSNWGRWGKDDQMGTLNLITPAKRKQAAGLVKDGVSVSLARTMEMVKAADVSAPFELHMTGVGGDTIAANYHGYAITHLDALAHRFIVDGKGYNGYVPDVESVKAHGHPLDHSILNVKNGIFTRGILFDIPRLKGVEYLEPGTPIYTEDLEAWEKMAHVKVQPGDAIFVRSGRWTRRAKEGPWDVNSFTGKNAGLHASVLPWLKKSDIALLSGEGAQSLAPGGDTVAAVHDMSMSVLGLWVMDNTDLDALAAACASRNRWEFLVTLAPMAIPGGTGSPINPIATF